MATTTTTTSAEELYLAQFKQQHDRLTAGPSGWLQNVREAALENFRSMGIPTARHEYWRHTNLKPLREQSFALVPPGTAPVVAAGDLADFIYPAHDEHRLVFVNGHFAAEHSDIGTLPKGTRITTLAEAMASDRDVLEKHLAKHAAYTEHPFVALNTAFMEDGVYIHIPRGAVVEDAIQILYYFTSPGEARMAHPRNLIVVGENSQVRFIETYAGHDGEVYFTNSVTEVVLEQNAIVEHYKIQRESEAAFHIATHEIVQGRDSNFTSYNLALGGRLVRSDINVLLDGEHVETSLQGMYLGHGAQHIDNHTKMDHARANCHSYEVYKGVLDERSSAVFNGKILVRQDAQKTDAIQSNHCLLLTDDATINTRPQLEIFADDVKCTHGATVGQIQDESMFYLQSRGIDKEAARKLLIAAYVTEIADKITVESLRTRMRQLIDRRFNLGGALEEGS